MNGKQGYELFTKGKYSICILDVMMPDLDGFEVLEMVREISNVPVIMLTAKSEEDDRVRGLEKGADDYVTKPFSPRELMLRVKGLLRRASDWSRAHGTALPVFVVTVPPPLVLSGASASVPSPVLVSGVIA